MTIQIKSAADIEKMRVAGRLASEVLDYLTPHIQAGVTTAEIDKLAHDYMVNVQGTIPAPLPVDFAKKSWGTLKPPERAMSSLTAPGISPLPASSRSAERSRIVA